MYYMFIYLSFTMDHPSSPTPSTTISACACQSIPHHHHHPYQKLTFNAQNHVGKKFFAEPGSNPDQTWTKPFGPEPEVQVQGSEGREVNLEVRVRGSSKCARTWTEPDPGQTTHRALGYLKHDIIIIIITQCGLLYLFWPQSVLVEAVKRCIAVARRRAC